MKKFLSFMAFAMLAVFSLAFVSCSDDDDENENTGSTSELVGTWDVINTTYYYDGLGSDIEDGNGAYWVFSANKLTVHDSEDLMNGKSVDYIYDNDSKELKVSGFPVYKVTELTNTTLVMRAEVIGGHQITKFKKR